MSVLRLYGIVIVTLLPLGSVSGCEVSTTPGAGYTCRSIPDNPHISTGEKKKRRLVTIAKVRTTCTKAIDSHRLTMLLERKKGDRWVEMARNTDERVPLAGSTQTSDVEWAGCIPGPWRLTIGGSASRRGTVGKIPSTKKTGDILPTDCELP